MKKDTQRFIFTITTITGMLSVSYGAHAVFLDTPIPYEAPRKSVQSNAPKVDIKSLRESAERAKEAAIEAEKARIATQLLIAKHKKEAELKRQAQKWEKEFEDTQKNTYKGEREDDEDEDAYDDDDNNQKRTDTQNQQLKQNIAAEKARIAKELSDAKQKAKLQAEQKQAQQEALKKQQALDLEKARALQKAKEAQARRIAMQQQIRQNELKRLQTMQQMQQVRRTRVS